MYCSISSHFSSSKTVTSKHNPLFIICKGLFGDKGNAKGYAVAQSSNWKGLNGVVAKW